MMIDKTIYFIRNKYVKRNCSAIAVQLLMEQVHLLKSCIYFLPKKYKKGHKSYLSSIYGLKMDKKIVAKFSFKNIAHLQSYLLLCLKISNIFSRKIFLGHFKAIIGQKCHFFVARGWAVGVFTSC